ncbi:hypothetical protein ACA910_012562 [Epithemia clementina (nom. ined.)]
MTTTTTSTTKEIPTIVKSEQTHITVYGATSFVAKHVLSYLLRSSIHVKAPQLKSSTSTSSSTLKITLAGRSESKLKELKYDLSEKMKNLLTVNTRQGDDDDDDDDDDKDNDNNSTGAGAEFDVWVAEASQVDELRAMAARTQVVLNCAGPFHKYGTEVVAACAELGTDYVDITGEVHWASKMREMYGKASKASGSRIVSFCGFDSIPTDVAVYTAVEALRARTSETVQVDKATTWVVCLGLPNAGTVHTILDIPIRVWDCFVRPGVPFLLDDPLALTHPTMVRNNPSMTATRNRLALAEWWNQIPQFHSFLIGGASGPFPMAVANAKVVHESALALQYGKPDKFVYYERYIPVGFPLALQLKAFSMIAVLFTQFGFYLFMFVVKLPIIGPWVVNTLYPIGSGISDESCQSGFSEIYAEVQTSIPMSDGGIHKKKVSKANCFLKFKGDPGNWITAQCVSEAALCLLLDKDKLPPKSDDGFGSPVEILGGTLLQRLTKTKVRPVQCTTNVRIATDKHEWCMFN